MRPTTLTWERFVAEQLIPQGWTPSTLQLETNTVPAATLASAPPNAGRTGIAAAGARDGEQLFVTCFGDAQANGADACRQLMARFLSRPLPQWITFAPPSLSLAGRQLVVPDGCTQVSGDTRIRCAHAELHWRDPKPDCRTDAVDQRKGFESLFKKGDLVSHVTVPCTVLGKASTCHKYSLRNLEPATSLILYAQGCQTHTAQCTLYGTAPEGTFPEPCGQVFDATP